MYLTQQTDYALRVLIYAAVNNQQLITIADIAKTYSLPKSYLMKVCALLVRLGFLESVRGKNGGLRLASPAETINVGTVVRSVETVDIVECMRNKQLCPLISCCCLAPILSGAAEQFLTYLDQFTLNQLINNPTIAKLHYMPQASLSNKAAETETTA
ncbi:RrF2 family transcriptional regulator [Stenoxybacter acetivorans]|uniref:RrF2 family transcriptional regulator n=1 Tax=Stenoxybacter acetivorans TaxID=422441 RepID=UPI000563E108|nr:Rrf2 family transcriptional regulator [Stenoxybacter acetivorans]